LGKIAQPIKSRAYFAQREVPKHASLSKIALPIKTSLSNVFQNLETMISVRFIGISEHKGLN
jgi:hypothetical protein